ncbi:MAG: hypothetical protein HY588_03790 [Candidatus Omnitrophica bacterium]|nr:hypothetical protein [Candidatus Omnitrophota bacterium]
MNITPEELKKRLASGEIIQVVDVREPEEYDICHLANATLIPMDELEDRFRELKTDTPVVLYCHHGVRSAHAAMWLKNQGFQNVLSLEGGIDAWAEQIDPSVERY